MSGLLESGLVKSDLPISGLELLTRAPGVLPSPGRGEVGLAWVSAERALKRFFTGEKMPELSFLSVVPSLAIAGEAAAWEVIAGAALARAATISRRTFEGESHKFSMEEKPVFCFSASAA